MVRTEAGWHCPQCGSTIVNAQAAKAAAQPRENVSEKS
jgi:predicted RNA-binding Zn-ribbon protein involved in translation (DUF1610 family)